MNGSGLYELDGLDVYNTYGLIVSSGSDDFLRLPALKEPESNDWKDENGKEYDLYSPVYETRLAIIKGCIIANSEADFWKKYKDLFSALSAPGYRKLEILELGYVFDVFYRENTAVDRLTRLKNTQKVAMLLELKFEIVNGGAVSLRDVFYFGAASSFPVTWADVIALPSSQNQAIGNILNLNTGVTYKNFVLAIPSDKGIQRIVNISSSNELLTDVYQLKSTITSPDNIQYNIFGFSQSVPYRVNNIHQITIK